LKRIFMVLLSATVLSATAVGQTGRRGPLEGVWKVAEVVVTGANPSNTSNPQPGLFIFARTHYSMMRVPGDQPRALYQAEEPTDAEKLAAFDSFVANTGTYETAGTTLTIRPMIARNPNFAAGGFQKYQFRIEGNTLWLTEKSTDLNFRLGERVVAAAPPANETRMKLTRVE